MNTPVLSKKQQKKLLSAKKGTVKGIRNVLVQPHTKFWPVLENDAESRFEELLERLLPGLKRMPRSIIWSQLRKMEKIERLAAQKKARKEAEANRKNNEAAKIVTVGVNAVTRDLEKDRVCSILLDSTVDPQIIRHVVIMAQSKRIPVLLVPFLREITVRHAGFACAAMALKKDAIKSGNIFHELYEEIVKFSTPSSPEKTVLLTDDSIMQVADSEPSPKVENPPSPSFTLSATVHKYRTTTKERAFVPPNSQEEPNHEWGDFIAIGKEEIKIPKSLKSGKIQRYVDIHAGDKKEPNSKRVKYSKHVPSPCKENEKSMEIDEFISFGRESDENESIPDLPESDDYVPFGSPETSTQALKNKNRRNSTYVPLIVKQVRGNNNRVKATKAPKSKKKSK